MSSCAPPSAISCLSLAAGSYSLMGCYPGYPLVGSVPFGSNIGSATDCITSCSIGNSGASYDFASIAAGFCYCGDSSSSPTAGSVAPSSCNILCPSDSTQLCGGYDGTSAYSEVYQYNSGGIPGCPILSTTTTTSSSTTLSTSTTSSAPTPSGTGCHGIVNGEFETGLLAPWTSNFPAEIAIVNAPPAGFPAVTPFAPSQYVLQVNLAAGQTVTVQQTVSVCPLTKYAPLISYQLQVDPAGGKKGPLICTFQYCELVTGTCGRVATMRAGKWGSNSPQFSAKATQTYAIVQAKIFCPVAAVAYIGQMTL